MRSSASRRGNTEESFAAFLARRRWRHVPIVERQERYVAQLMSRGIVCRLHDDGGTCTAVMSLAANGVVLREHRSREEERMDEKSGGAAKGGLSPVEDAQMFRIPFDSIVSVSLESYEAPVPADETDNDDDSDLPGGEGGGSGEGSNKTKEYVCLESDGGDVLLLMPLGLCGSRSQANAASASIDGIDEPAAEAQVMSSAYWVRCIESAANRVRSDSAGELPAETSMVSAAGRGNEDVGDLLTQVHALQGALEQKQLLIAQLEHELRRQAGSPPNLQGQSSSRPLTAGATATQQVILSPPPMFPYPVSSGGTDNPQQQSSPSTARSVAAPSSSSGRQGPPALYVDPIPQDTSTTTNDYTFRDISPIRSNAPPPARRQPPTRGAPRESLPTGPLSATDLGPLFRTTNRREETRQLGLGALEPAARRREDVAHDPVLLRTFEEIHGGSDTSSTEDDGDV